MSLDAVVFSPHLDDAALSAASRLMRPGTDVVTVFAGQPPHGTALTGYDRFTRATSTPERYQTRLVEDDEAMRILGCRSHRLDELDLQYCPEPPDRSGIAERLVPFVERAEEIWAPAGVGGHPDHVAARDAVIAAAEAAGRLAGLFLYAEVPYSVRFGWPGWMTGEPEPQYVDIGYWLDDELAKCGLDPARLKPEPVALTPLMRERKERAVRCYRTQLPGLRLDPDDPRRWEPFLRFELAWRPLD